MTVAEFIRQFGRDGAGVGRTWRAMLLLPTYDLCTGIMNKIMQEPKAFEGKWGEFILDVKHLKIIHPSGAVLRVYPAEHEKDRYRFAGAQACTLGHADACDPTCVEAARACVHSAHGHDTSIHKLRF